LRREGRCFISLRRRRRVEREINLDNIATFRDTKHPDRILELDDGSVIVIEETRRPRPEDIDKLLSLLETVGGDWSSLLGYKRPTSIICVVHHTRSDTAFYIHMRSKGIHRAFQRYRARIIAVECNRELRNKSHI